MYQFITGSLLGMELRRGQLYFKPCFPSGWPSVGVVYRYGAAVYRITVFQEKAAGAWWISDGGRGDMERGNMERGEGSGICLVDDGREHVVEVHVGV